jgi:hypothetical protein
MAHRHKKGEIGVAGVAIGRRAVLARLGLGVFVASAASVLLTLGSAQAGVVVGDGDLDNHNDKGNGGTGSSEHENGNGHGSYIGQNRRSKPESGRRITVRELLEYLANFGKRKTK